MGGGTTVSRVLRVFGTPSLETVQALANFRYEAFAPPDDAVSVFRTFSSEGIYSTECGELTGPGTEKMTAPSRARH